MQWYVIQTKPRQEGRALEHLERQGYACYLPTITVEKLRPGNRSEQQEPLFQRYLFIQLNEIDSNWYPISSTRGVSRIVRCDNKAVPIADRLVEEIRHRAARDDFRVPYLRPGERVRVSEGAFTDVEAIFLASSGDERVILLLNILQSDQRVSFPMHSVRKVS